MFVWTISDVLTLAIVIALVVLGGAVAIGSAATRAKCKHDGRLIETQACDAICEKCGKNMGFIGKYRPTVKF